MGEEQSVVIPLFSAEEATYLSDLRNAANALSSHRYYISMTAAVFGLVTALVGLIVLIVQQTHNPDPELYFLGPVPGRLALVWVVSTATIYSGLRLILFRREQRCRRTLDALLAKRDLIAAASCTLREFRERQRELDEVRLMEVYFRLDAPKRIRSLFAA